MLFCHFLFIFPCKKCTNSMRVTKQKIVQVLQSECARRSLAPPCDKSDVWQSLSSDAFCHVLVIVHTYAQQRAHL